VQPELRVSHSSVPLLCVFATYVSTLSFSLYNPEKLKLVAPSPSASPSPSLLPHSPLLLPSYPRLTSSTPVAAETEDASWKGVPASAPTHPIVSDEPVHAAIPAHLPPASAPCGRLRQKAVEISNNIRKILGMPMLGRTCTLSSSFTFLAPPPPPHHGHHYYHYHRHHDGKAAHGHPDRMLISGPNGPIIVAAVPTHPHGAHSMHPHPGPSRIPRPPVSILHLHHASFCCLDVLDYGTVEPSPF
jgi:hypothetical protein